MKPAFLRTTSLGAAILLAFATPRQDGFRDLREPAPLPDGLVARLGELEQHACAKCHADVFAEWSSTLHALAWVSEPYQEELAGKSKPQGCHGCHIPERLLEGDLAQKPEPRAGEHGFGVDCVACHQAADGSVHGPWGLETDAHRSVRDERFVGSGSNALCASCHRTNIGPVIGIAKDFPPTGRACVDCHMAKLERKLADGKTLRPGRSHALQTPRDPGFLARAFELSLVREGAAPVLRIANQAGHRMPGLVGREFSFEARAFDAAGTELTKVLLEIDTRKSLAAEGRLEHPLPAATGRVLVVGRHTDPRQELPIQFLERELR